MPKLDNKGNIIKSSVDEAKVKHKFDLSDLESAPGIPKKVRDILVRMMERIEELERRQKTGGG